MTLEDAVTTTLATIMETTALSLASRLLSAIYVATPSVVHKVGVNSAATYTSLGFDTVKYFIRADNGTPDSLVNVFDGSGKLAYTIERTSKRSTKWIVYTAIDRAQVAAIVVGLRSRHINYLTKPHLRHQILSGILAQNFNLNDGTQYEWTRGTRLLERVINPGGGHEEVHERVAQMNLLRRLKYDWEILIDKKFDPEVAICTAFVASQTIWSQVSSVAAPHAV